jgi:hypothetical protein
LAVAQFDGDRTAVERYSAAKNRTGEDARWTREVGIVEHRHNGRLALRGTCAGHYPDVDQMLAALGESAQHVTRETLTRDQVAEMEASLSAAPPAS